MKANQIPRVLVALVVAGGLLAAASKLNISAQAQGAPQGRRNFDPAQMQQMMMDRIREQFEVKNDDEWKIIQERLQKVMEARMAGMAFSGGMGMAMGRPPGGGRGFMGGEPNPDAEALQQAVEAKAQSAELKQKLEKFRAARKASEAKLEAAQEDLRQVLSVRQEAVAALFGLVK